jgi:hypothetical protein
MDEQQLINGSSSNNDIESQLLINGIGGKKINKFENFEIRNSKSYVCADKLEKMCNNKYGCALCMCVGCLNVGALIYALAMGPHMTINIITIPSTNDTYTNSSLHMD